MNSKAQHPQDCLEEEIVDVDFDVTCSYLEIYQETIYDLLDPAQKT